MIEEGEAMTHDEDRLGWPDRIRLFFLFFLAIFILAFVVDAPNSFVARMMRPVEKHPWASLAVAVLVILTLAVIR